MTSRSDPDKPYKQKVSSKVNRQKTGFTIWNWEHSIALTEERLARTRNYIMNTTTWDLSSGAGADSYLPPYLADDECKHGRLPTDPTPPCDCWSVEQPESAPGAVLTIYHCRPAPVLLIVVEEKRVVNEAA